MTADITDPEEATFPHYVEARIEGLFGEKSFPLEFDPRMTVVTGENGSGKSTVLAAISALSRGRWKALNSLPLDAVEIVLSDGTQLRGENNDDEVIVTLDDERWVVDMHEIQISDPRRRREVQAWLREVESGRLSREETEMLQDRINYYTRGAVTEPEWLQPVLEKADSKLISARRLEHRLRSDPAREPNRAPESVVDGFSQQMSNRMRLELSRYAAESQRQEKSLPSRIVHAMQMGNTEAAEEIAVDVDRLRAEVRQLAELLARVGLFDEDDPDQQLADYPRDDAGILLAVREVYRVARERLSRLNTLRSDLDLFATFLNERFTGKQIELSAEHGIAVVLSDRGTIKPSQLSSGEQQLLALAYELLFGTKTGSLVLLDEPELSLHVAWLKGLISSFMDIGERRNLQFVVATHSPSIVAGFLDRERSLDLV